jgi:hypothetical protein
MKKPELAKLLAQQSNSTTGEAAERLDLMWRRVALHTL